jgi:hypothetical protein
MGIISHIDFLEKQGYKSNLAENFSKVLNEEKLSQLQRIQLKFD